MRKQGTGGPIEINFAPMGPILNLILQIPLLSSIRQNPKTDFEEEEKLDEMAEEGPPPVIG